MLGVIGDYSVIDLDSVGVISFSGSSISGVATTNQQVIAASYGTVTSSGLLPPLRNIDPIVGGVSLGGSAPTISITEWKVFTPLVGSLRATGTAPLFP